MTAAWAYTVPRDDGDPDVLAARLWAAGATGVWVRPDDVVGYFPRPGAAVPAGGTWAEEADRDWLALWREGLDPVSAGAFEIVPTWLAGGRGPVAAGVHRIVLDPGRAFGSGHHDTTAGCLEALSHLDVSGRRVLDVGTGTGVLAIGARLAGAGEVVGVDVDPDAVTVARENAAANGVDLTLTVGSVRAVAGTFDLVLANLLTHTVVALATDLAGALAPGGTLIASGIGRERADAVAAALEAAGLEAITVRPRGEWVVITARRPAA